jgi:uncharacterized protein
MAASMLAGRRELLDPAGFCGVDFTRHDLVSVRLQQASTSVVQPVADIGGMSMSQPVVHFEIAGKDPARLRRYFGDLFGWEFEVPSPVAHEVSEPDDYGFLNLITSDDGAGIPGGVGGGPRYESHAVFYVGVQGVEEALQRAEELGGTRIMGPARSPNGLVVGHFRDPEGTLIGVAGVA